MAENPEAFVVPAGLRLEQDEQGLSIEHDGDIVLHGTLGQRLRRVHSRNGDVVLHLDADLEDLAAPRGAVIVHGSLRTETVRGRQVHVVGPVQADGVYGATVRIEGDVDAGVISAQDGGVHVSGSAVIRAEVESDGGDVLISGSVQAGSIIAQQGRIDVKGAVRATEVRAGQQVALQGGVEARSVEAGGDLTLRGASVDITRATGRVIQVEATRSRIRAAQAESLIEVMGGRIESDVFIAPTVQISPETFGRITGIEAHNELGATGVRGGLRLDELAWYLGDVEAFLAERGLSRLDGSPRPDRGAPPSGGSGSELSRARPPSFARDLPPAPKAPERSWDGGRQDTRPADRPSATRALETPTAERFKSPPWARRDAPAPAPAAQPTPPAPPAEPAAEASPAPEAEAAPQATRPLGLSGLMAAQEERSEARARDAAEAPTPAAPAAPVADDTPVSTSSALATATLAAAGLPAAQVTPAPSEPEAAPADAEPAAQARAPEPEEAPAAEAAPVEDAPAPAAAAEDVEPSVVQPAVTPTLVPDVEEEAEVAAEAAPPPIVMPDLGAPTQADVTIEEEAASASSGGNIPPAAQRPAVDASPEELFDIDTNALGPEPEPAPLAAEAAAVVEEEVTAAATPVPAPASADEDVVVEEVAASAPQEVSLDQPSGLMLREEADAAADDAITVEAVEVQEEPEPAPAVAATPSPDPLPADATEVVPSASDADMPPEAMSDPIYMLMLETVGRMTSCYTDADMPPAVHRLRQMVERQDYDAIRSGFSTLWNDLVAYHRDRGLQLQPRVSHTFRTIDTIVRNL